MSSTGSKQQVAPFALALALAALLAAAGVLFAVTAVRGFSDRAAPQVTGSEWPFLGASLATGWQSPSEARHALESRTEALTRLVTARGGTVRILSTDALMRTRTERGTRLAEPQAHFERTFELQLAARHDDQALRQELASTPVRLDAIVPTRHANSSPGAISLPGGDSRVIARAQEPEPRH